MSIGYACLNTQLAEEGVNPIRGMIRKTWLERGLPHASQLALQNCQDLLKMVLGGALVYIQKDAERGR